MAEDRLHHAGGYVAGAEQAGAAVAKNVEADAGTAGALQDRVELREHQARLQRLAGRPDEHHGGRRFKREDLDALLKSGGRESDDPGTADLPQ